MVQSSMDTLSQSLLEGYEPVHDGNLAESASNPLVIQTYSYRIKNSSSRKHLCRMAGAVNFVWNYCNEVASEMWGRQRHWATAFDLNNRTSGAAKDPSKINSLISSNNRNS